MITKEEFVESFLPYLNKVKQGSINDAYGLLNIAYYPNMNVSLWLSMNTDVCNYYIRFEHIYKRPFYSFIRYVFEWPLGRHAFTSIVGVYMNYNYILVRHNESNKYIEKTTIKDILNTIKYLEDKKFSLKYNLK